MVTSGVKQENSDEPTKLIDAVISEIGGALFPDDPHPWLEHFSTKLKALSEEPETSDRRLWWTIHGREIGNATDVKSAIRYLVLAIQPGLEEFRGIYIDGGLGDTVTAKQVCRSLHVPKRRGAVNWMTDCIRKLEKGGTQRRVLTLFDAWMDLRGHAASEDLILGNRSVAGFPLYLPRRQDPNRSKRQDSLYPKALTGYFFISHPMPGLFYKEEPFEPLESFVTTLEGIREHYEESLAMAVDMDIFAEFAARTRPDHGSKSATVVSGGLAEPLIDLSSDDLSGYTASMLLPGGAGIPECAINEGAFARQLWSHAGLLSFFPGDWQELTSSMEAYSRYYEKSAHCPSPFWDPQEHSEDEAQRWRSVNPYYPSEVSAPFIPELKMSSIPVKTNLHERFGIFKKLYSLSHVPGRDDSPQADLVIPLGCQTLGADTQSRVAGFIRINCDSAQMELTTEFQQLYRLVTDRHVGPVNDSLGRLLLFADSDLRSIHEKRNAGLFKQAYDAVRQFADWSAKCLAARGTLPAEGEGGTEPTAVPFNETLLRNVMRNVWSRINKEVKQIAVQDRCDLLDQSISAIRQLAKTLSHEPRIPFTLVTFWLKVWTPTVKSISGNKDEFVDLIMKDPGLMDVLQHLVLIPEHIDRDLCAYGQREVPHGGRLLDLGYPHHDANLTSLHVASKPGSSTAITWKTQNTVYSVSLEWATPVDSTTSANLIPAALAIVDGRVSDRIARNIASSGSVTLSYTSGELKSKVHLGKHLRGFDGRPPTFIEDLERLFIDQPAQAEGYWTMLPLKRDQAEHTPVGYLSVLVPYGPEEENRPIVAAARDLSLGRALAQFRAEALEREKGYALHQGAIAHGERGSFGRVSLSISTMLDILGRSDSSQEKVSSGLKNLQRQVDALGSLASDALYFARSFAAPPTVKILSIATLREDVEMVQRGFTNPSGGRVEKIDQLPITSLSKPVYDRPLFRHALARILENAQNEQIKVGKTGKLPAVIVGFQLDNKSIVVRVLNAAVHPTEAIENIRLALQGLKFDSSGLREAWTSVARSSLSISTRLLASDEKQLIELSIGIPVKR